MAHIGCWDEAVSTWLARVPIQGKCQGWRKQRHAEKKCTPCHVNLS